MNNHSILPNELSKTALFKCIYLHDISKNKNLKPIFLSPDPSLNNYNQRGGPPPPHDAQFIEFPKNQPVAKSLLFQIRMYKNIV